MATYLWPWSKAFVPAWALSRTISIFGSPSGLAVQIGENWNFRRKSRSYCNFSSPLLSTVSAAMSRIEQGIDTKKSLN